MRLPPTFFPLLLAAGLALGSAPARADDGDGPQDDPRAKLKAQAERVLKLMRENEAALLEASTLGGHAPKGPEVPVPPVEPGAQPPPTGAGGSAGGGPGGSGTGSEGSKPPAGGPGARGEEIRKRIEELIQGQQQGASRIPEGLAELVRMIPTTQGGSGSGGDPSSGKGGEQETPEAREARQKKELQEQQQQQKQGGKDPQGAEKHDPGEQGGRPPGESDGTPPPPKPDDPNATPWRATLPPEYRSSEAGGGLERLPGRLGQIIEDYLRNLHKQTTPGAAPR